MGEYIQAICTIGTRPALLAVLLAFFPPLPTISSADQDAQTILPAPIIDSKYFPCSQCHGQNRAEPDTAGKSFHAAIQVADHTEGEYGCFDCHDKKDLDRLRLFNGSTIDLSDSSKLCGQCHSTNYTLWLSGLHGKVIGKWNGPKTYTPCTACHDPHRPNYEPRRPEPPPTPPEKTLWWQR